MTESLRYRTASALALICFGLGVVACLIRVYVLYSRELANYDLRVIAVLILMVALTIASLLMARSAKKRIRTLPDSNQDTGGTYGQWPSSIQPENRALAFGSTALLRWL